MALANIGMVTSAAFGDVNGDKAPDLIIAGEWMPLTLFINRNGTFEKIALPASSGWWQTIFVDDVNKDGNLDILAGNWGWNNKFSEGKNAPVKLYVSDFDKNGRVDQLLSYTRNGKEYPFLAKDEMERALPELRKHYLLYADYAGLEMKDAFYGYAEKVKPFEVVRTGSAVCYGNGKGGFTLQDLPAELQLAPIFTFQKAAATATANQYVCGGNFFDVIPYEGRYDAQAAALFSVAKNETITYLPQASLSNINAQLRDLKWLHTGKDSVLIAAPNNGHLLFFKPGG
jgi:hypothetical protein